jgi:hypothetical protein
VIVAEAEVMITILMSTGIHTVLLIVQSEISTAVANLLSLLFIALSFLLSRVLLAVYVIIPPEGTAKQMQLLVSPRNPTWVK